MLATRFDDARSGTGLVFPPPDSVVVASRVDQVAGALAAVERAVAGGAWASGVVAYEAAPGLDPVLVTREPVPGLPLVRFALSGPPSPAALPARRPTRSTGPGPWRSDTAPAEHARAVEAVRARIAAGETYQANLTTRFTAPWGRDGDGGPDDPIAHLHADLLHDQCGRHHALLDLGRHVVVSASPETFFEVVEDAAPGPDGSWGGAHLVLRPMKGTAARGRSAAEDALAVARLSASAKERAENLMIVDLLRNDASRVAEPASITTSDLFAVETYPTVHQLVSTVGARLRAGTGFVDVMTALFPCGSITGAPKASTTAILAGLERSPRGVYCGAVGWLAPPGERRRASFSVAIRTVVVDRTARTATYGSGGGITWGSRAADEHREVAVKASVLTGAARAEDFQLLETLADLPGTGLVDLERHLRRLIASAAHCGFALDVAAVRAALARRPAPPAGGALRVRVALSRDGGVEVEAVPLASPPAPTAPVRLAVDAEPVDSTSWWPRHKTSRREGWAARLARHPEADDVVVVNERGEVCESSVATVVARLDGRWWTPPVEVGCLPGVRRERLLEEGVLDLRVLSADDLARADALALVSSLRGWRPAVLLPSP